MVLEKLMFVILMLLKGMVAEKPMALPKKLYNNHKEVEHLKIR